MRYNLIWSSAIALSLITTSLSYAQVIEIDFRSGFNETGRSIDNSTLGGAVVDTDAEVIERTGIPFSVPVLEDERTGAEQLMLTVNGFTGGEGAEIQASASASLGLGINSDGIDDSFFAFDADLNESLTISFSQDLFIQEVDLVGLDAIDEAEEFRFGDTLIADPPPSSTADVTSLITNDDPDGMFLEAGETLLLEATVGSVGIQGITVQIATDDIPIDLLCDVNLDNVVNFLDIAPFISVLTIGNFQAEADCNQDGVVNFLDIAPFITILTNSI